MTMLHRMIVPLLIPLSVAAQQPKTEMLKPADGRIDSVFQSFSVRVLRDGRLLLPGRNGMEVADFATHGHQTLTGVPNGRPIALPADSTVIVQYQAGWVFLDGTRLLGMLPATNPVVTSMEQVLGFDHDGDAFGLVRAKSVTDSDRLVKVSRSSGAVETIGKLWAPGLPNGVPAPAFMVFEQAVGSPDGWLAAVRSHPYRVDWRSPTGNWVHGAPIEELPVAMDQREIDAYIARQMMPPRGSPRWPATIEPFTNPEPVITPDGMMVVKRTPTADQPGARYDVIDRRGALVRTIRIGDDPVDMIVAFGASSVYLWVADQQHRAIGHLERHPWP
jgi:hypothetical protein